MAKGKINKDLRLGRGRGEGLDESFPHVIRKLSRKTAQETTDWCIEHMNVLIDFVSKTSFARIKS